MDYLEFHHHLKPYGCFDTSQIRAFWPSFNRKNLLYWQKKGFIVKLRNGHYAFADAIDTPDFAYLVANRVYEPSYVSLQTALAHYGIIPEAVVQSTSVTTLKTASYANALGQFCYQSIAPQMMFGYVIVPAAGKNSIKIATPEKAIIDFLYLNKYYNNRADMLDLRFDPDFMAEELDRERLHSYLNRINSQSLTQRMNTLLDAYAND